MRPSPYLRGENAGAADEPERVRRMLTTFTAWDAELAEPYIEGMRPEEWSGKTAAAKK